MKVLVQRLERCAVHTPTVHLGVGIGKRGFDRGKAPQGVDRYLVRIVVIWVRRVKLKQRVNRVVKGVVTRF